MQTAPGVAAILNPFAAASGMSQASGQAMGVADLQGGLFGDEVEGAQEETDGFGQALDSILAAALGAPLPTAQIQASPPPAQGTAPAQSHSAPTLDGGQRAFLAGLIEPGIPTNVAPSEAAVAPTGSAAAASSLFQAEATDMAPDATLASSPAASTTSDTAATEPAQRPQPTEVSSSKTPVAHPAAAAAPRPDMANVAAAPAASPPAQDGAQPSEVAQPSAAAAASTAPVASTAASLVAAQVAPTNAPTAGKPPAASVDSGSKAAKTKAAPATGEARAVHADGGAVAGKGESGTPAGVDASAVVEAATLTDGEEAQGEGTDLDQPSVAAAPHAAPEHRAVQSAPAEVARATPQTVAHLAAQIANKVEGKATRFDVQLDPHGLGKVEVRVEIGARGDISAALTFENPQSAAELRGKSNELQAALEQAGFDLSKTTLSFSSGDQGRQQGLFDQQQQQNSAPVWRGRAFTDLSEIPETALAPVQRRAAAGGVDVRI